MERVHDVVVIGAGVSGCAIARELARTTADVVVVERDEDVCCGTSKANSAIVHAGFDAQPGTLMARLNVEGSNLMPSLCEELGVDYDQCGSLVVCCDPEQKGGLEELKARGEKNGVVGLSVIDREELVALEPNVSDQACCALWAPTGGIVNPFQLTVALAEVAAKNGVDFRFNERVVGLTRNEEGLWHVATESDTITCRCVINAAGVYADEIHNLVCADKLTITPRRGQYHVLDTTAGSHVRHTVFALPTKLGKGVLVTPTTSGNLLVGPTAEDIEDKEGVDTTAEGLAEVVAKSAITVRDVPFRERVRTFSGLRAHQSGHDFVIGEAKEAPGYVDCAAIESPGLSSAPAIGLMVAGIVAGIVGAQENPSFDGSRSPIPRLEGMDHDSWARLVAERPDYGEMVCRCRLVSVGQIRDAIHRPVGARSVDGVKRRVEAGMGRCQGGFCEPTVMGIIAEELGIPLSEVTKKGPGSEYVVGANKDALRGGER